MKRSKETERKYHARRSYDAGMKLFKREPEKAFFNFRSSAGQGYAESSFMLAICNERGKGTDKNISEAYKWYWLANKYVKKTPVLERTKKQ